MIYTYKNVHRMTAVHKVMGSGAGEPSWREAHPVDLAMLAAVDGSAGEPVVQRSVDMEDVQPSQNTQEPKPRLIIQQIVMENFKSYAGRQVIGPFHKVH